VAGWPGALFADFSDLLRLGNRNFSELLSAHYPTRSSLTGALSAAI
jgi:hypothetical protein